jgi:phospholipase C
VAVRVTRFNKDRLLLKKLLAGAALAVAGILAFVLVGASADDASPDTTATPIKHVVVIFDENVSFDHYFATYPNALNLPGETPFHAKAGTPAVNGLNNALLTANPNAKNPLRLARSQAVTCSSNHSYGPEQAAMDGGLMDRFVEKTGSGCSDVMNYFDGNTVTGIWNLAQSFALNDNSFDTQFGPSTVGAINVISGDTHGATPNGAVENGTVIGDADAGLDDCGNAGFTMSGPTIGDLLSSRGLTWGWFQGGFRPTTPYDPAPAPEGGPALCKHTTRSVVTGVSQTDYSSHHEPFMYYPSTANQHHLPPTSVAMIGQDDQAKHQYDLSDFWASVDNGTMPAVSYLKAPVTQDGHPSSSNPLDEQVFLANTIDRLEDSPEWSSTAVILAYDDSDGWYDHVMPPIVSTSNAPADQLNGTGVCGNVPSGSTAPSDRCGYGPRLPLLVISPFAKQNYVDHTLTDQTSILRFIEDNWHLGPISDESMDNKAGTLMNMFDFNAPTAPKVYLDPSTGEVTKVSPTAPDSGSGDTGTTQTVTVTTPGPTVTNTVTNTVTAQAPATGADTGANARSTSRGGGTAGGSASPKLRCTTAGTSKKLVVTCTVKGRAPAGKTNVRVRLDRGKKVLATKAGKLAHGRVKLTLKPKHVKKGAYTLLVTVTTARSVSSQHQTVHLSK